MNLKSDEEVQKGYWVNHGWPESFLKPINEVEEYNGEEILAIAFAKPQDTPGERKKRLNRWCKALPKMKIRMLKFHAAHQSLLNSAAKIRDLEALQTGTGRLNTLEAIGSCISLKALIIDSCPSLSGLSYLAKLAALEMLSIENVREAQDLQFLQSLTSIWEFSINGTLWTDQKVNDLWPLTSLKKLQVLTMFSTRILNDGLQPLHQLKDLVKFECSLYFTHDELLGLKKALPSLRYGTLIGYA